MSSRQLSLSNSDNGSQDKNGTDELGENEQQNRTDDLESVLNRTPALRKYIKRRKSLSSSIKLQKRLFYSEGPGWSVRNLKNCITLPNKYLLFSFVWRCRRNLIIIFLVDFIISIWKLSFNLSSSVWQVRNVSVERRSLQSTPL